jgi:hypothetical protein
MRGVPGPEERVKPSALGQASQQHNRVAKQSLPPDREVVDDGKLWHRKV